MESLKRFGKVEANKQSVDKSTCAVCVGDHRRSWLGGVRPRPQHRGRDALPLLGEPRHPELVLGRGAEVGHRRPENLLLIHWVQNFHLTL